MADFRRLLGLEFDPEVAKTALQGRLYPCQPIYNVNEGVLYY